MASNLSFVDPNAEPLTNALIAAYERLTGATVYPASPERLFILWVADIIVQERMNINWAARQNIPSLAEGAYLDQLGQLFHGVTRRQASAAASTIRFYLSKPLESAQLIPKGTRVSARDSGVIFETTEDVYIPAGAFYGDAAVRCQTVGTGGNGLVPGQLCRMLDVFPYFDRCENTTTSEGGAEIEDDLSLYARMRASEDTYSTAGPMGGYEYHAKAVSAAITDVKVNSPVPGVVKVYALLEGGKLPDTEMRNAILDALSGDKVRPLTDKVEAAAPETVPYQIDLTYYIPSEGPHSAQSIETAVADAVGRFAAWQSGKMGRDINPSKLTAMLMETGVKRVELRAPAYTTVNDGRDKNAAQVAVLVGKTVINGSYEDE